MPIAQIGAETQVNTATTGDQTTPQAIALADGTYVVVWKTPTGWSLQQFDANGSKVGSEVANTGVFPATWEALPDGRLAYAYRYGFFGHLFFGILNGDGSQSLPTVELTAFGLDTLTGIDLATNSAGDVFLAASSETATVGALLSPVDGQIIFGGSVAYHGNAGHEGHGASHVRIAVAPDGAFLVVYDREDEGVEARYFSPDGEYYYHSFDPQFPLPIPFGAQVVHGYGELTFAWVATDEFGATNAAVGTTDGSSLGAEWLDGAGTNPSDVKLWQLGDGRLLITWTASSAGDGDGKSVMGQLVAFGLPIGEAFVINSNVTGDQTSVSVATLADGRFVATWQTPAIDGNGLGIAAQMFDPRLYTGTDGNDFWIGGSFAETISGGEGNDTLGGEGGDDYVTGDGGNDRIIDSYGKDTVEGGAGDDTIIVNLAGLVADQNDIYDGGTDTDTLHVLPEGSAGYIADLRKVSILNFERLVFADPGATASGRIQLSASQIGAGFLSGLATIDATGAGLLDTTEILEVSMGSSTELDLSGLSFVGWGAVNDRVEIVGDSDAETITGSTVADRIVGGSGDDTIDGMGGNDTIVGSGGNDTVDGGAGTDTADYSDKTLRVEVALDAATAVLVQVNGVNEDSIRNVENLIGGSASDKFTGDALANSFAGNAGNDIFRGGAGNDTIDGGANVDTADYSEKTVKVEVTLGASSAVLVKVNGVNEDSIRNVENLIGGSASDKFTGDALANSFAGNAGNDTFRGGAGSDTIDGGANGDTADYSEKTQKVEVALNAATAVLVKVNGVNEDSIRNVENLIGGSSGDKFTGDALANSFAGNAGNDTFRGGSGNDTIDGGANVDTADYSEKTQKVEVALNAATAVLVKLNGVNEDSIRNVENLIGGSSGDKFVGDDLANLLVGNSGADSLSGGNGSDVLKGGLGKDVLDGGGGGGDRADYTDKTAAVVVTLKAATAAAVTVGGASEDTVRNVEQVFGGSGADKLTGDSLANYFAGNGGKDVLVGNSGKDTLNGGLGADTLDGGSGADRFTFDSALGSSNVDRIKLFEHDIDRIELDNAVFTALSGTSLLSAAFYAKAGATKAHDADDRIVYDKSTGKLYYDDDGKGGHAAVHFATLSNKPTLDHGDFAIV